MNHQKTQKVSPHLIALNRIKTEREAKKAQDANSIASIMFNLAEQKIKKEIPEITSIKIDNYGRFIFRTSTGTVIEPRRLKSSETFSVFQAYAEYLFVEFGSRLDPGWELQPFIANR